jgi:hypothetical protein
MSGIGGPHHRLASGGEVDAARAADAPAASASRAAGASGAFGISGTIPASRVTLRPILSQGLDGPTAMALNPRDGSLWIVNEGDDSSVVIDAPGTSRQRATKYRDDSAHFMNNPTAIAFSPNHDEFATAQETRNDYNGAAPPNMFMGPTLWTADRRHYDGGTRSHLDMLHHSPNAMGIAAGAPGRGRSDHREYWVFNGDAGSIDRYWFNKPHVLGGTDHADGKTYRYAPGELARVPGVPGHMAFDAARGQLYIADTGHGRIVKLDTRGSVAGARPIRGYHDETPLFGMPGTHVTPLTGRDAGLVAPCGLIVKDGKIVVSDHATGHIKVFGEDGTLEGDLDTGLGAGAITGLAEGPGGKLYALDRKHGRLVEVDIR